MLAKIYIDISHQLNWELEEQLFKICNGFEVDNKSLILWVSQDLDSILFLLNEANVDFHLSRIA